jgi:hypothetical protein
MWLQPRLSRSPASQSETVIAGALAGCAAAGEPGIGAGRRIMPASVCASAMSARSIAIEAPVSASYFARETTTAWPVLAYADVTRYSFPGSPINGGFYI